MWGGFVAARVQRQQAEACRRMAERTMEAQADAADRAMAMMPYIGWVYPPPVEKINGRWYAIRELPPSVPRVKRNLAKLSNDTTSA